eukprot:2471679-Alexandrium_andersonii.AAC.1
MVCAVHARHRHNLFRQLNGPAHGHPCALTCICPSAAYTIQIKTWQLTLNMAIAWTWKYMCNHAD